MVYQGSPLRGLVSMWLGSLVGLGGMLPMLERRRVRLVVVSSPTLSVGGHGANAYVHATILLVLLQGQVRGIGSSCTFILECVTDKVIRSPDERCAVCDNC